MEITLNEAAARLGVTPRQVQRLANEGKLQVVRQVGRSILVDAREIHQRQRVGARRGRRWNGATAWAAIEILETGSTARVSGSTLSRLQKRLMGIPPEELVRLCAGRAQVQRLMQTRRRPAMLEGALLPTGRSSLKSSEISQSFGLAGGTSALIEGYVRRTEQDVIRDRYGLEPHAEGSVFLLVCDDEPLSSMTTVALDLCERGTTRERSAAQTALQVTLTGWARAQSEYLAGST
ncbi:helix-turn-helix domain-containing protein [Nesterenkonia halotolerans]|uniref:helix-turn-helix domain-containing protein n=1 Tax=Nesterenkonia halotolerans TaxID=225325 RepID=UPI003EE56DE3